MIIVNLLERKQGTELMKNCFSYCCFDDDVLLSPTRTMANDKAAMVGDVMCEMYHNFLVRFVSEFSACHMHSYSYTAKLYSNVDNALNQLM